LANQNHARFSTDSGSDDLGSNQGFQLIPAIASHSGSSSEGCFISRVPWMPAGSSFTDTTCGTPSLPSEIRSCTSRPLDASHLAFWHHHPCIRQHFQ
jgi:hypothetical protein